MSLPFTSLDAVSVVGPGEVHDLGRVEAEHTMVVVVTGISPHVFDPNHVTSPSLWQVNLEVSHDGENWFGASRPASVDAFLSDRGSGVYVNVFNGPARARYVRANLTQLILEYPDDTVTVTATIATVGGGEDG